MWWDGVKEERTLKNKARINSWRRMIDKLRCNFIPQYYKLVLFRKLKNPKQKSMTVREFTEDFYKVNIRSRHIEDTPEKFSRYVNSLRFDIQYELSLLSLRSVEEAYQVALKAVEKLMRKQIKKSKAKRLWRKGTTIEK